MTPTGRLLAIHEDEAVERRARRREPTQVRPWMTVSALLLSAVVFGFGSFLLSTYDVFGQGAPTDMPERALARVQAHPSREAGLSVEEFLQQQVEKSHEAGRLTEAEGWNVEPLAGASFRVFFSFQEVNQQYQVAEWTVDLARGTLEPTTPLAETANGK